jgi:hypothetical protein
VTTQRENRNENYLTILLPAAVFATRNHAIHYQAGGNGELKQNYRDVMRLWL